MTPSPKSRRKPWPYTSACDKPNQVADAALFKQSVVSPLRYPGAKRQLAPTISALIGANVPPPRLLIEPFCGGASIALGLTGQGVVDHAVLNDADPIVAAFWYTAAFDTRWLVSAMWNEPVTVARWDWWRLSSPKGRRERALKCLFLNRTTFSGILHGRAGPIGGRAQQSKWAIDCRFGRKGLQRRIEAVGNLGDTGRILDVWNVDWREALRRSSTEFHELERDEIVVYCDPPYVDKAPFLYEWSFDSGEHLALSRALTKAAGPRWILSYDDNDVARKLYSQSKGHTCLLVRQRYTAAGSERRSSRDELLVTNYDVLPSGDVLRVIP